MIGYFCHLPPKYKYTGSSVGMMTMVTNDLYTKFVGDPRKPNKKQPESTSSPGFHVTFSTRKNWRRCELQRRSAHGPSYKRSDMGPGPLKMVENHWVSLRKLVGGFNFNPFEKYESKWVHLPQIGMKMQNI